MNRPRTALTLAAGVILACGFTGCANLKRVADPAHYYVLSAESPPSRPVAAGPSELAVGIGAIEIPNYLLDRRIAVCRGAHEVSYLDNELWAERLDKGLQRVIAADLRALLSSDRVFPSAWRRDEVQSEVYISVEGLECDDDGRVTLQAHWRITPPGGETTWHAGHQHVAKQGPAFRTDPAGAVAALSHALHDLSLQIATDLQSVSTHVAVSTPQCRSHSPQNGH